LGLFLASQRFKRGKPDRLVGIDRYGQLLERSEGVKAQWQTGLDVAMATGLNLLIKLAAISIGT